ncbi:MAG: acetyltransferase [Crocinitomicaceae bacterium]|jgi:sugar O-acyltransferase (sialic acid O-acetyltransferase NeuD family)
MIEHRFILGYSGHSYPIIEALKSMNLSFDGYFETKEKEKNPFLLNFLGNEDNYSFGKNDGVFIAIGDNYLRKKIADKLKDRVQLFSIIDSQSIVRSEIGQQGIIINAGAVIQPQCLIGEGTIINSRAVIEHECELGNFCHIAPGSVLNGNVIVGEFTLIGSNATILPGIKIGKNCVIGAGSVVTKDVKDNTVVKGNPARL